MTIVEQALKLLRTKYGNGMHIELYGDGSGNLVEELNKWHPKVTWNNYDEFVKWCHDLVGQTPAPKSPSVVDALRSCLKREMMKHKSGMVNIVLFEDGSGRLHKADPTEDKFDVDDWSDWDEFGEFVNRRSEADYHKLLDEALSQCPDSPNGWLSVFTDLVRKEAQ